MTNSCPGIFYFSTVKHSIAQPISLFINNHNLNLILPHWFRIGTRGQKILCFDIVLLFLVIRLASKLKHCTFPHIWTLLFLYLLSKWLSRPDLLWLLCANDRVQTKTKGIQPSSTVSCCSCCRCWARGSRFSVDVRPDSSSSFSHIHSTAI